MNDAETRQSRVTARVLRELASRPNYVWFVGDLAAACELDERQVQRAINYLRSSRKQLATTINVLVTGNAWQYSPDVVPSTGVDDVASNDEHASDVDVSDVDATDDAPTTASLESSPALPDNYQIYECVGSYRGDPLLRDSDGRYWRAQPIDLTGGDRE